MFKYIILTFISFSLYAEPTQENKVYKEFFKNGDIKYEVTYFNGDKNGKEIFWHENGLKKMQSNFLDGVENGLWQQWHDNGQLKLEINYLNGKENGLWQQMA